MYPVVRLIKEVVKNSRMPRLQLLETHVSHHRCWPQDIDQFLEMNNGRILTLLDLGRMGLGARIGLLACLRENGWGLTVAGSSVRYRKRIRPFVKFRMKTRCLGWDARFVYVEQAIWIGETCAVNALFRTAVTDAGGIVTPDRLLAAMAVDTPAPVLPDWVANWIAAEATRPWPPVDL